MKNKKDKKSSYLKDRFSKDAEENDAYLFRLRELAKDHPEIRPEYESFCTYQAGFANGVLNQVETWIRMSEEMKQHDKEKEYFRDFFKGADGITYDKATFLNITEEQFIDWVNQMAEDGYIPQGEWQDYENQWGGATYKYNKSFVDELKPNITPDYYEKSKWGKKKKGGVKDEE